MPSPKSKNPQKIIATLQERIKILESESKKFKDSENEEVEDDEYGTPFSCYGLKKEMPKNRAALALEFFEIFEELFTVECTEKDLHNYEMFDTATTNARNCLKDTRESINRFTRILFLHNISESKVALTLIMLVPWRETMR